MAKIINYLTLVKEIRHYFENLILEDVVIIGTESSEINPKNSITETCETNSVSEIIRTIKLDPSIRVIVEIKNSSQHKNFVKWVLYGSPDLVHPESKLNFFLATADATEKIPSIVAWGETFKTI